MYIKDYVTGRKFLIDSGACISVLPVDSLQRRLPVRQRFRAANGSSITSWGAVGMDLCFGKKFFRHSFKICDISQPILGADFFAAHGFQIDFVQRRLVSGEWSCPLMSGPAAAASITGI